MSDTSVTAGTAEVVGRKTYGRHYHSLEIAAPDIARRVAPGQFVNVRCEPGRATILRRPFSVARVRGAAVEIVFDIRGRGTEHLAGSDEGDRLDLLGPLGRGFRAPEETASCLLVGGGIGAAPLFFLADDLLAEGHRVDFILGARRADLLLAPDEARRLATTCRMTTEDGSAGDTGRVTDVLRETIANAGTDLVLACGPHPMLAAVTRVCSDVGIRVQVAVEEMMACGWGVCMTCVMPLRDQGYVRSCTEGPVFEGTEVVWNGTVASRQPAHATLPEIPSEHAPPGN